MSIFSWLLGKSNSGNETSGHGTSGRSRQAPEFEIVLEERAYDRFSPFTGILYSSQAERDADPVHQARYDQYVLDNSYPSEGGNW